MRSLLVLIALLALIGPASAQVCVGPGCGEYHRGYDRDRYGYPYRERDYRPGVVVPVPYGVERRHDRRYQRRDDRRHDEWRW